MRASLLRSFALITAGRRSLPATAAQLHSKFCSSYVYDLYDRVNLQFCLSTYVAAK